MHPYALPPPHTDHDQEVQRLDCLWTRGNLHLGVTYWSLNLAGNHFYINIYAGLQSQKRE